MSPTCFEQVLEPRLVRLLAGDRQRQPDVLLCAEHGEEVEELEDEADVLAPQLRQVVVAERRHLGAVNGHRAGRRLVEPREDVHQRRLARARRAHDGGQLASGDVEVSRRATRRPRCRPLRSAGSHRWLRRPACRCCGGRFRQTGVRLDSSQPRFRSVMFARGYRQQLAPASAARTILPSSSRRSRSSSSRPMRSSALSATVAP